jgi:hypothetical protein
MKSIVLAALAAALLAGPLAALAQGGPGPGPGSGPGRGGCPCCDGPRAKAGRGAARFDPATVTTVQGDVVEVQRIPHRRAEGVHLLVRAGADTVDVHLGPDFWVDAQAVKVAAGDRVEAKGSRVTLGGEPVLLAQEVRKGSDVLALRDADGLPLWRRGGR